MITLHKATYGGIDWHDSNTRIKFLCSEPNNYDFGTLDNAKQAMIEDIVSQYPYEEERIRKAFETNEEIEFPAKVNIYDKTGNKIGFDYGEIYNYNGKIHYESTVIINPSKLEFCQDFGFGQVDYIITYYIEEVKNPVYAVIENFLAVTKGVPTVERIYHKPFASYEEAKEYMSSLKAHTDYDTEIYIACFDADAVNKEWYEYQLKVIKLLEDNKELSLYDDTFSPFVKVHYEKLAEVLKALV